MIVAIVGSRKYENLHNIDALVEKLIAIHKTDLVIISGGCRGVDSRATDYAKSRNVITEIFPASWNSPGGRYDPKAGIKRNKKIADRCNQLYCFYCGVDYKKSGSLSTVEMVAKQMKPWFIIGEH